MAVSGIVECEYGLFHNTAVIDYSAVSNEKLWNNARDYAHTAIEFCGLHDRNVRDVAGEIRAHALGEHAPPPLDPGGTIDMAGSGDDPQAHKFGWLMDYPNYDKMMDILYTLPY